MDVQVHHDDVYYLPVLMEHAAMIMAEMRKKHRRDQLNPNEVIFVVDAAAAASAAAAVLLFLPRAAAVAKNATIALLFSMYFSSCTAMITRGCPTHSF